MKTCSTCRFMAAPRDDDGYPAKMEYGDPHATCTRIIHGNGGAGIDLGARERERLPAAVVDGSGYAARLVVLPTFGCVLHEEKQG